MTMTTRMIVGTCSAILLSGCSWLGIGGGGGQHYQANNSVGYKNSSQQYNPGIGQRSLVGQKTLVGQRTLGRCQITSPTQAIPPGCQPEQVTLALGGQTGGYNRQGQYTSGGYGSHVGATQNARVNHTPVQKLKRPKLRGQLSLGLDPSLGGTLFSPSAAGFNGYSSADFFPDDGTVRGTPRDGVTYTITNFSSTPDEIIAPDISFGDVYTAPLQISGGLEYIINDHNTIFANAGFTRAEGKRGGGAEMIETISADVDILFYDNQLDPVNPADPPVPFQERNITVASVVYEFNELERYDLELGARHYFNPILPNTFQRPITPFISASGGASYYKETTQRQLLQQRRLDYALVRLTHPDGDFENIGTTAPVSIYDAQWVPYGAVKAGLEWQVTAKTALAFEAGIKYETARDFSDGTQGDDNISIPLTIRGSYNF
ncbi:MAG: hypothetical protein JKY25_12470 [Robiginitomaculum sp.]|nr:hypothetical protein [Robiginitomaculum sp.]